MHLQLQQPLAPKYVQSVQSLETHLISHSFHTFTLNIHGPQNTNNIWHLAVPARISQHNFDKTADCQTQPLATVATSPTLQVPEALDMGLAPVKGTVSQALKATNTGDAAVHCTWEAGQPFSIVPSTASIEANQSVTFTCHFQPSEASVYTVLAACHADTGYTATVKVGFTVRLYMHLLVRSPSVTVTTVFELVVVILQMHIPVIGSHS